jgi:hypothetical protein
MHEFSKTHLDRHLVVGHGHKSPIDLSRLEGAQLKG